MSDLSLCFISDKRKCHMVDSTAFNEIITGYAMLATDYAAEESIPIERAMPRIFDEYSAEEALTKVRG